MCFCFDGIRRKATNFDDVSCCLRAVGDVLPSFQSSSATKEKMESAPRIKTTHANPIMVVLSGCLSHIGDGLRFDTACCLSLLS